MNYKKEEIYNADGIETLRKNYTEILKTLGEDTSRDGLEKTPERVAKAMHFLTQGYHMDADAILKGALFKENHNQMVVVKDIELYSLCEHHLLPFYGRAHIAYIPNGTIVGLSKLARIVDVFSRRLQVQERLTIQVRDALQNALQPLGVAVVIEAKHLCMMMRGVSKQNSVTTTSAFTGEFEKEATRNEFIKLISSTLS
ncbi:MAG: GTP cyclohydrolase I FolE [Chitinophagales bacterium]|nr:GTP cyclohydrolase I FolE [Chitinophagales bacterium]